MTLKNKKLWLLDLDGTIYLSETVFDGTIDFLNHVKAHGGRYVFLSNNSSKGTETYIEKMARMGIEAHPDDFLTSTDATVDYLKENYAPETKFYVLGTKSLKDHFRAEGVKVVESYQDLPDALILGYDTELSYKKIEDACIILGRRVPYIATHPDLVCPTWYGYAPDAGSFINMLEEATGRRPDKIIGKPQPEMIYSAMKKFGATPAETCVIGDRIYTDIASAVNAGVDSIFVLSGEGVESDIKKYMVQPTYIMGNIREVLEVIEA